MVTMTAFNLKTKSRLELDTYINGVFNSRMTCSKKSTTNRKNTFWYTQNTHKEYEDFSVMYTSLNIDIFILCIWL